MSVIVLVGTVARSGSVPGRRVAGAGVLVAASGLCVTEVGIDFFDDTDIVEKVLSRVEFLREFFLKKLRDGILRFVDDMEVGEHIDVSYKKGMILAASSERSERKKC